MDLSPSVCCGILLKLDNSVLAKLNAVVRYDWGFEIFLPAEGGLGRGLSVGPSVRTTVCKFKKVNHCVSDCHLHTFYNQPIAVHLQL